MASTYILYSSTLDSYYIGHSESTPEERLKAHLRNHSGYTGKAKDWQIVWSETFISKSEAYKREREIKKWKSRRAIENLIRKE
ncbi:MAG TPA: GIY-YIG nuclease family protein [Saprospiraceae bacterium]|nr:GIY-YIG nuclease family protein [Saprospiraceae bacterium]